MTRILQYKGGDIDLDDDFGQGDVITWQVGAGNAIFDYAAIRSQSYTRPQEGGWLWYITGAGRHYGDAVASDAELFEYLHRDEVRGVWCSGEWSRLADKEV